MNKVRVINMADRFVSDVEQKAARAMTQVLILGASEAASMTPIETSTLINSQFQDVDNQAGKIVGTVGYTAEYALNVHEAKGTWKGRPRESGRGNYWDPSGEPRFLEKGFEDAEPNIEAVLIGAIKT